MASPQEIACRCGQVALRLEGEPLVRAVCYCHSCQEGGRRIGALKGAEPVVGADGGTDYVLARRDRIACVRGSEHLRQFKLKPGSPTRRVVAGCCNSGMFTDFSKGHWLSLYRGRFAGAAPPIRARMMTAEKPDGVELPNDAPAAPGYSGKMMGPLLKAWVGMGFRIPKVKGLPDPAPDLDA